MIRLSIFAVLALLAFSIPAIVVAEACASGTARVPAGHTYETELEATVAAVGLYRPAAVLADREFTGAILKMGNCFTHTVLAGSRTGTKVIGQVHVPWGAEIVGYWHADHFGAVMVVRSAGRGLVSR